MSSSAKVTARKGWRRAYRKRRLDDAKISVARSQARERATAAAVSKMDAMTADVRRRLEVDRAGEPSGPAHPTSAA